jgi:hypothetical protein
MIVKEPIMSEAKRQHSQFFHHARAAGHPLSRSNAVASKLLPAPEWANLRVLEPWENTTVPRGDPYNGVGARAVRGRAIHK